MSWSEYCNQLVGDGKTIAHAAVFAHQDQVMGYSPSMYAAGLAADPNIDYVGEVNNLNAALNNPSLAQASGIKAGGIKYMFIRSHVQDGSNDPFLSGNKGGCGISVRKTKAVVLIATSAPGMAVQCDMAVFKAAQSLIAANS